MASIEVTLTIDTADAQRITAAAAALGYASGKAWVIAILQSGVTAYEQSQLVQTYDNAPVAIT